MRVGHPFDRILSLGCQMPRIPESDQISLRYWRSADHATNTRLLNYEILSLIREASKLKLRRVCKGEFRSADTAVVTDMPT